MMLQDMQQGSPEWLLLRQGKITGTDAAIINNTNPYRDILSLWEEKLQLREPEPMNERMKRGSLLEEPARILLIEKLGINFTPRVIISDVHNWCMASVDGLSDCGKFMCEIKSPSKATHEQALDGHIKIYYQDQMQHCLYVTGAEKCYYCSYLPGHAQEIAVIEVYPDREYIERMIEKEKEFWIRLCTMQPPEKPWEFGK